MSRSVTVTAFALALSACAVGPDYVQPMVPAPAEFERADAELFTSAEAEAEFWHRFGDPMLTRLVNDALAANHDLRIALSRYEQARALLRHTRYDRYPTVTASGNVGHGRSSADQLPGVPREDRDGETHEVAVEAAWELDFFGRVRRAVEAGSAEVEASAAELAAAQVSVIGELARSYYELRGLQGQLAVARENADNQRGTLELVVARLDAGRGTQLDASRARAQLESTLAQLSSLEAEVGAATHRIAVLTGRPPAALIDELAATVESPALPEKVATGVPSELLRRRPDIVAAERRLASATARIGVATADLFPRFTLGAMIGSQAASASDLFERDSETRVIALGIDWSFLDAGRVRARIAAADAEAAANMARYEQTILLALEETENALLRYVHVQRERAHLEEAAVAGADAARLARLRYDGGVADFLQVLDAERSQLEIEDRLVQSRARGATALVALYRALAGGWPDRTPQRLANSGS
jgi:outer membrane protein, multidrug efflux system